MIPQGQYEAGMVLGMTKWQVFFRVVLMQVVKRILAPIANEVITLVKQSCSVTKAPPFSTQAMSAFVILYGFRDVSKPREVIST